MRRQLILVGVTGLLSSAGLCLGACPSADLTGDCFVDYEDFALMAAQWLTTDPCIPDDMAYIPDGTFEMGDNLGNGASDERPVHTVTVDSFYMGKYEITNGQYRDYLNSALGQGLITVTSGVVYKAGSGTSYPYCDTSTSSSYSQIAYSGGVFSVRTKNGRNMSNDPMVQVSWYGAADYCNWRSQQDEYEQCYNFADWTCDFSKKGYRLATEAEWEYAARGGLAGRRFPRGDTISQTQANFRSSTFSYDVSPVKNIYHPLWNDGIYPLTSPVGFFDGTMKYKTDYQWPGSATSYQTTSGGNSYGLYDMTGNVLEWCNDWYEDDYYMGRPNPDVNPTGPISDSSRVIRGGSWTNDAFSCRVAFRLTNDPTSRLNYIGFSLVLDLN
jgi:formylglycine-generating enzyme required for sulfatase activity